MVLTIYYQKKDSPTHTYRKNVRSYKQMDEEIANLTKKGYVICGGNIYR